VAERSSEPLVDPDRDQQATGGPQIEPSSVSSEEKPSIDALTQEIAALSDSMRQDMQAADKGIAAAGALIVAGLSVALLHKATIVLVALPYGLGIVFFFTLQKYAERNSSAGIRSYLEKKLHDVSNGTSPVMQQHIADYWHRKRRDEWVAYGLYVIVIAASFYASLYTANQAKLAREVPFSQWMSAKHHILISKFVGFAYIDALLLAVLLAALCVPFWTMVRAPRIARKAAKDEGQVLLWSQPTDRS
jgi:hypothetical protein